MGLLDSILSAFGLRRKQSEEPDAGESEARDPELEAIDDRASFDFDTDIARYFTAEFRIETSWGNPNRRASLFREYTIRDVQHWYQVKATFERWLETPAAKAKYRTPQDLMQARMSTTQTMSLDDLDLEKIAAGADRSEIEGVSLERWAKAEAALESGAERAAILESLGLDEAGWVRVSDAWNDRMADDASGQIAAEFAKHVSR